MLSPPPPAGVKCPGHRPRAKWAARPLSTLGRNLIWLAVAAVANSGAMLLYGVLAARYLGPADFGRLGLVAAAMGWMFSLGQSGGTTALTLLTAQDGRRASALLCPATLAQFGTGCAAGICGLLTTWALSRDPRLLGLGLAYGVGSLAALCSAVPVSIYRGLDRMEWGVAETAALVGGVGCLLAACRLDSGLPGVVAANSVARIAVAAMVLPLAYRALHAHPRVRGWTLPFLRLAAPLWAVALVQAAHWRVGVFMVQLRSDAFQLGLYSAAAKIVEGLRVVPWLLLMAALPGFARAARETPVAGSVIAKALLWVSLLALPVCGASWLLAPWAIPALYSRSFAGSTAVLKLASLGIVPLFSHWVFLNAMISLRMERQLTAAYLLAIAAEVAADLFLVPALGAQGAAAGFVLGQFGMAALSGFLVARRVPLFARGRPAPVSPDPSEVPGDGFRRHTHA